MSKHVYSLVLMDEVVEAIDRLAYQQNTSRSNLINQILAERVCCITPQMRMNDIFSTVSDRIADDCFQVQTQPSEAMLSIRSALKYKYKPTIRYSLELYRSPGRTLGALKVSFRTQSAKLLSELTGFYRLWAALEQQFLLPGMPEGSIIRSRTAGLSGPSGCLRISRSFLISRSGSASLHISGCSITF